MEITLKDISQENFNAVARLAVRPDQRGFVASNTYSMAEAHYYPEMVPQAVYDGETLVGFVMYTCQPANGAYWIMRLMVDAAYQGKGYGRAALELALERMKALPGCTRIKISYDPENEFAAELYRRMGFAVTGEIEDGEIVAEMAVAPAEEM